MRECLRCVILLAGERWWWWLLTTLGRTRATCEAGTRTHDSRGGEVIGSERVERVLSSSFIMSSADPDELPLENESDDDDLWDEVVVPEEPTLVQAPTEYDQLDDLEPQAGPSTRPNIEITLKKAQSKIGKGKSATEAKYVRQHLVLLA